MNLKDQFGRTLSYLRVSLTDRCNLRCVYCMPEEGVPLLPREEILRIHEFERLLQILVSLGITKIRLTGGEPLLRRKIVSLVALLAQYPSLKEIALTTNGIFLSPLIESLQEAGLGSVNISLDSLDPKRYFALTRGGDLSLVLDALMKSLDCGLKTKINVVAMDDLSRVEVCQFVELAKAYPVDVRFLEFMPLCGSAWTKKQGLEMTLLKKWVFDYAEAVAVESKAGDVAHNFKLKNGQGRIGFIDSLSQPFCGDCTRLRLTSTGQLRLCLFSPHEIDLRQPLRSGASDDDLAQLICEAVWHKPKGHEELRMQITDTNLPMIRSIGG